MPTGICAIVGAGGGLGQALAARFARGGYTLALLSRTATGSAAALAAAQAARPDGKHAFFAADASHPDALSERLTEVARAGGDINVLIYNPRGAGARRAPLDMTFAELEEIYRLEVLGAFAAAKAVMPAMISRGHGNVMFSSATAAFRGSATNPLYAIGKFALRGLTQSLAKAYAKSGVHVTHLRLDCGLDVPVIRDMMGASYDPALLSNVDDVAETYWWVHQQPKSAWSNEVELRPYTENWTY